MRFALLGMDEDVLDLAQVVLDSPAHEVVALFDAPADCKLLPSVRRSSAWESLLDESTADGVIVASDPESKLREEQLRRLVQAGISLLVVHPACPALHAFELEMIQHDIGGSLVAYHPAAWSKSLDKIALEAKDREKPLEQIIIERHIKDRSKRAIWNQLARDADLARSIMGDIRELTAIASGTEEGEASYSNLLVNMKGPADVVCRWSVMPAAGEEFGRVMLQRSEGRLEWHLSAHDRKSSLKHESGEHFSQEEEGPALAIAHFVEHCQGKDAGSLWRKSARSLEIADAVPESLRRRRAIDFHLEEHSEQQTFKGIMAAGSCLILFVALISIFLMTVGGGLLAKWPIFRILPIALLALLICFLSLQLLGGKPTSEKKTGKEK